MTNRLTITVTQDNIDQAHAARFGTDSSLPDDDYSVVHDCAVARGVQQSLNDPSATWGMETGHSESGTNYTRYFVVEEDTERVHLFISNFDMSGSRFVKPMTFEVTVETTFHGGY